MAANTADLLVLARTGAVHERGLLLEKYRCYLELLARVELGRRLQKKVDVSDVVQETFLEVHCNFHRFRGESEAEFTAWLRAILSSRTADLVRHYVGTKARDVHRERGLRISLDESSRAVDRGLIAMNSSPSQQAMRQEQGVLLADALARLPDDYREVLVLRHLEELTFPEVARRMDRTVNSVKNLWVRGVALLRRSMRDIT